MEQGTKENDRERPKPTFSVTVQYGKKLSSNLQTEKLAAAIFVLQSKMFLPSDLIALKNEHENLTF